MANGVEGQIFGQDLFGDVIKPAAKGPLEERFVFPPFTVLSAREGEWQERKRAWLRLGIRSELGRPNSDTSCATDWMKRGAKAVAAPAGAAGGGLTFGEMGGYRAGGGDDTLSGTSIFDPVLCELNYRWFCPLGGTVVDPFAGGSVRGIVAGCMGRPYYGMDIRQDQIEANRAQAEAIKPEAMPVWQRGDSAQPGNFAAAGFPAADFVFSCPPYGDLDVYSSDPDDISNMPWPQFAAAYAAAIDNAVSLLKPDRFAAFVIGDFRDPDGFYRNLTGLTTACFEQSGAHFYNEAILVTPAGSLPIRATKQFETSRKLGKTHQNWYIYCKGDPRKAAAACQAGVPTTLSFVEREAAAAAEEK